MGHIHLSRREILESIPVLSAGARLAPLWGERPDTKAPGVIRGALRDGATGQPAAAKLRVVDMATGQEYVPEHAIKSMPQKAAPGVKKYFYARGKYEIAVPPGRYQIEVVRGICHEQAISNAEVGASLTQVRDIDIPLLSDMHAMRWYSGNTHTHYHLEIDEDPDDRLRMVPPAEALDVSVISYLVRGDSPYITNRYPIGRLPDFSRDGTLMDMGEEARNNKGFVDFGYGHCLFLNIPRRIDPASTGLLSRDGKAPDFPTLSMLCEEAKRIGGTTVWAHNGSGMEVPVAVAQGHVDAYNLGDGLNADYERYYRFLNCGFHLPASTGTDWWIYDHNRVFVQVDGSFSYDSWIAGLRAGRTFVSNGPLLELSVNGNPPGASFDASERVHVRARAISRLPFDRLQIVQDGAIVAEQPAVDRREAILEREIPVEQGGWLAARVESSAKTHALWGVFAHSSPVYYRVPNMPFRRAEAAGAFVDEIERSVRFIRKSYKFASDADRAVALGRFESARQVYGKLAL